MSGLTEVERLQSALRAALDVADMCCGCPVECQTAPDRSSLRRSLEEARAGWYQNRDKADLCDSLLVTLDRVMAIKPEDHATSSRDYGRGYAQAIRDVHAAIEEPS